MTLAVAARPWLFSARIDLLAFTLPAVCALALVALLPEAGSAESPEWLWVVGVLLVDVAHVWSTAFLTYLHPGELARHPARYALIPGLGWVFGVLSYALGGPLTFWRCLAYLAVLHFVRQQYGWMALYRAREGDRGRAGAWIDGAAIYAATLYPLVYWHVHLPRRFAWFLPGDFVAGLPESVASVAAIAYGACLFAYVLRALARARSGAPVPWGKHLLLATTAATWYVGIVGSDSDYAFTLTNVLAHGIPYAVLVFTFGRHSLASERGPAARLLGGSALGAALRFTACLWLVAFVEELLWDKGVWHERPELFGPGLDLASAEVWLVPLLAVPQLTHYVLDGLYWRRAQNPALRAWFLATSSVGAPPLAGARQEELRGAAHR